MTPQQAEALRMASIKIRQDVDRMLAQRTPEQKQQELNRLVKAARHFLGQAQQAKAAPLNSSIAEERG